MTLSPTWIGLFEWSATICELAGHWFVQSTLLIAAGLLAGRLFANRGPAFASAIYRTTLVAAFLCPIVTWCLAQFGMTLGITALPELRVAAVELVAVTRMVEAPAAAPPVRTTPSAPREPAIAPLHGNDVASSAPDAMMSARGGMPAPERMPEAPVMAAVAQGPEAGAPEPAAAETAAAPEPFASAAPTVELVEVVEMVPTTVLRPWTALLVGFLAVSWLMITALFLLRVVFAHIHLLSLRRAAHPAPAEQQQICWQVAEKLGVWPPVVLTSPFVAGPCLAGVIRPAILLPDELPELPLATVFVHELAHLRRRDCLWNVVRQVVCAVLFFQPLAWRLSRRLEVSAEEVCDDHVVEHGADRGTYADILVSLAERTLLPASSAVVPLVTFRSLLGRRVARILDRTRRLSLSISLTALALILAGGLAATLGTGVLGPAGRGVPAGAEANEKSESIAAGERESATTSSDREADAAKADVATTTDGPATAAGAPTDDVELHYRGRVVDTDDKPVAGAKIFFHYWLQGAAPRGDLSPLAVTDADGAFDFSTKTSDFDPLSDNSRYLCGIVATAEGYGFAHGWSIAFETTGEARKHLPQQVLDHMKNYLQRDQLDEPPVLQLVRDDAPLVGQVVSIEGKPVPGARVRLHDVMLQDAAKGTANLDGWEQEARDPKARFYTLRNNHVPVEINTWQLPSIVHDVTADAEGRFTMRGVGRERVAELMISGPDIETSLVKTRTRGGEVLRIGGFRERGMGRIEASDTVYPHKFTFAAGPSKPITGRITDAETGAPIAGVRVSLGQVGTFMSFGKHDITSMTDADGRYRLEGLALDDSESIIVWPAAKSGYVPTGAPVKLALDKPAPEKDFQIRHGVWLRGQATDKATGRPIPGRVQYFARSNNPHLKSYPGLARSRISYEARSDAAGRFEMPIPPGPGIVTYMAMDHTRYRRGQGAELVSDGTGIGGTFAGKTYKTVPSMLIDSNEIILREINPSEGDQQVEVMLPIESGLDVYGKIVDAQGKPVVGGLVGNAVFNGAWYTHPIRDNTFHVEGY
ncbi:MAG TPA: M56 family metallopeptidase, partial [Pirellulales bacterium]|nr:M56 family metallopeptidase [Pirellulales bacterium]